MPNTITEVLNASLSGQLDGPNGLKEAVNDVLKDKLEIALEARKIDIAREMLSPDYDSVDSTGPITEAVTIPSDPYVNYLNEQSARA